MTLRVRCPSCQAALPEAGRRRMPAVPTSLGQERWTEDDPVHEDRSEQTLDVLGDDEAAVVERGHLLSEVWNYDENNSNIVDVYIRRLRVKLEDDPEKPLHILAVRGIGYKFVGK